MHLQKFTGFQVGQLLKHSDRDRANGHYGNENIKPEKTPQNIWMELVNRGPLEGWAVQCAPLYSNGRSNQRLQRKWLELAPKIEANHKATGARLNSRTVRLCSLVLTLPKTVDWALNGEEFFRQALRGLQEILDPPLTQPPQLAGKRLGRILGATLHLDETTPHMHVYFLPLVLKGRYRVWNSRQVTTRQLLLRLHPDLDSWMKRQMPRRYLGGILLDDEARLNSGKAEDRGRAVNMMARDKAHLAGELEARTAELEAAREENRKLRAQLAEATAAKEAARRLLDNQAMLLGHGRGIEPMARQSSQQEPPRSRGDSGRGGR